jgi:hypothetical protein
LGRNLPGLTPAGFRNKIPSFLFSIIPIFHHSNIPVFSCSTIPLFLY